MNIAHHEILNLCEENNTYRFNYIGMLGIDTNSVALHSHPLWEVVYYTQGSGILRGEEGKNIPFGEGDFVLIPPGYSHGECSGDGYHNIHFTTREVLFPQVTQPVFLHDDTSRPVREILRQAYVVYHTSPQGFSALLDALFETFACYARSLYGAQAGNPYVEELQRELLNHLSDADFSLKDTLSNYPFHPEYLRRLFRQEIGKSPGRYLSDLRLDYARRLLLSREVNRLSVKEISSMCGFSDPLYFSRLFTRRFGVSPAAFPDSLAK